MKKNTRQKKETDFTTPLNLIIDPAVIVDAKGQFLFVNKPFGDLIGQSPEELTGTRFLEISALSAESKRLLVENLKKRMQGISIDPYEVPFTNLAGECRFMELKAQQIEFNGQPADFVMLRDITRRKENARKLQEYSEKMEALVNEKVKTITENAEKLRSIFNSSPDAIVVTDLDTTFMECNETALKLFGFSRDELIGKNTLELVPAEEQQKAVLAITELANKGYALNQKYVLTTKSGKEFPAEVSVSVIKDNAVPKGFVVIIKDISERKKAEEELLASEKKYRQLFESLKVAEEQILNERDKAQHYLDIAAVMLVGLDKHGCVTLLNKKGCEILNCTAEEAIGKNWFDNFLPRSAKGSVKRVFQSIIKGEVRLSEYNENLVLSKNGETHLIAWRNTVLKDSEGKIIGTLSSGEDVTERKQLEDMLRENEEKFRAISDSAMDAIILLDEEDKVLYWNPAAERIFGYKSEEAVERELKDLCVPKRFHEVFMQNRKRFHQEKLGFVSRSVEIVATRKDGTEFPIELSVGPLKLKNRQCTLQIVRDVSERQKMVAAIEQERKMLEAVTENIGAGLIAISKDYRVMWANGFIKRYKGDVEGKLCYATLNTLDHICPDCGVKKVFENGVAVDSHEYSSTDVTGRAYTVELVATPIKDKEGNVVSSLELAVDITEKKQMQTQLAKYSQKLEQLVAERTKELELTQAKLVKSERLATIGELAAMIGHDLRNPLTSIMGATYYLKTKQSAQQNEKRLEMLGVIEKAIEYSNKIVNDLLEYSRELNLALAVTTPKALLKEALSIVEVPSGINVVDAAENNVEVKVDTSKLIRALVNIINNAIDAMPEGGTLTVTSKQMKDEWQIVFQDTGMGMKEEILSKLWSPLFTTKAKGMGFGLPVCKRIIEAHGGEISVMSQPGKGTTFTITIPICPQISSQKEEIWIYNNDSIPATVKA